MSLDASDRKLLDVLIYADLFDCAPTFGELLRYGQRRVTADELQRALEGLVASGRVGKTEGYYHLPGRDELATKRPAMEARANRLRARARTVAGWLRHLPFVRGIHLTGSVAANHAGPEADIDLLVVVRDGRLGLAFLQLGLLSRIVSRHVCCPNYYVNERDLTFGRRSLYVAREIAQAEPLLGASDLLEANPWVAAFLPQAGEGRSPRPRAGGSPLQGLLEWLCTERLGDWLERRADRIALRRLERHYEERERSLPSDVRRAFERGESLRFHASDVERLVDSACALRCSDADRAAREVAS